MYDLVKFRWKRGRESATLAAVWTGDGNLECAGVEEESGDFMGLVASSVDFLFGFGFIPRFVSSLSVNCIAENGYAEIFEMDAELMSATGGGFELEKGVFFVADEDFVISLRGLTVLVDLEGSGAFEVATMA